MDDDEQGPANPPGDADAFPAARIILPAHGIAGVGEENPQPRGQGFGADQTDEDVLELLKGQKDRFCVAMLGFRTAGKTWLLNRIKRELARPPYGLDCDPPYASVKSLAQPVVSLGRSDKIEDHVVLDTPPFSLIDVHGELVQELANGNFAGARMLVAVLQRADAVIIAVPCDALLFGEMVRADRTDADTEQLAELIDDSFKIDQLNASLVQLAGLVSLVRSGAIQADSAESYRKFTPAMVRQHLLTDAFRPIGGADGFDCPAFCAMTKADRVLGLLDVPSLDHRIDPQLRETLLACPQGKALAAIIAQRGDKQDVEAMLPDPSMLVEQMSPEFYGKLTRAFPLMRFDFVSAFFGHDQGDAIQDGHYDRYPELGVTQILEWMADVRRIKLGKLHKAAALGRARQARVRLSRGSDPKSLNLQRTRGK